jgi:origin recognition complex subunit 5
VLFESIGKGAARDLESLRMAANKLWRPFVQPIVDGTFGTRDFARLMVSRRSLFQGEEVLTGGEMSATGTTTDKSVAKGIPTSSRFSGLMLIYSVSHELPYYSKYILCAAYLASYNPARLDGTHFMKATERKRRKRGRVAGSRASKSRKVC